MDVAEVGGEGDEVRGWEVNVINGVEGLEAFPSGPVGGECGGSDALKYTVLGEVDEMMEWVVYGNISSEYGGTGVGVWSASGAKSLSFWKWKRDRESAMRLR